MNYEAIIHSLIDDLVADKNTILIRELPNESDRDITLLIISTNEDIARLIGKKGSIASALREVVSIAGKLDNKRVHLKFESYNEESDTKQGKEGA